MASQPIPEMDSLRISEPQATPAASSSKETMPTSVPTEDTISTSPAIQPLPADTETNPWASDATTRRHILKTPDPSSLEAADRDTVVGLGSAEPEEETKEKFEHSDKEKGDIEDNVWEGSVGAQPSTPDVPSSNPGTLPSFPSLAALARSFSITPKQRPMSVDMAASVPSPNTLSSFATQQQQQPRDSSALREVVERDPSPGEASPKTSDADPPFDFQKFLDQMKTRPAEPVSKYLKSFLTNFAKRTFTVADQIKIINDFLVFIAKQMRETDLWRDSPPAEFENAMEGMEKLVMNQLYQFTFTPAVAQTSRRAQITADDLERDRVLEQRIRLLSWIEPNHLDVPASEQAGEGFLGFAQQELLKINSYKAPRDKLICILNSCKVIFGYLRHLQKESAGGADDFLPILIYTVIKANPEHLLSNVEFISRFRSEKRMGGEAGYYLNSLMGAVSFIETMDHTALSNITQEEFESNVERAIQTLPPDTPPTTFGPSGSSAGPSTPIRSSTPNPSSISRPFTPDALSLPAVERLLQKTGSALGRIWNEALDGVENARPSTPSQPRPRSASASASEYQTPANPPPAVPYQTPYKPRVRRISPSPSFMEETPSRPSPADQMYQAQAQIAHAHGRHASYSSAVPSPGPSPHISSPGPVYPQPIFGSYPGQSQMASRPPPAPINLPTTDPAALDTLIQIFPGMDREIIEVVLDANEGDIGRSIEGLLEMSAGA